MVHLRGGCGGGEFTANHVTTVRRRRHQSERAARDTAGCCRRCSCHGGVAGPATTMNRIRSTISVGTARRHGRLQAALVARSPAPTTVSELLRRQMTWSSWRRHVPRGEVNGRCASSTTTTTTTHALRYPGQPARLRRPFTGVAIAAEVICRRSTPDNFVRGK